MRDVYIGYCKYSIKGLDYNITVYKLSVYHSVSLIHTIHTEETCITVFFYANDNATHFCPLCFGQQG